MWVKEFYGFVDYVFEMEEYGVIFYVYCVCWLFDLVKIYGVFNGFLVGVICVKGYFWIGICLEWVIEFLLVGVFFSVSLLGIWWVFVFKYCWLDDEWV